MWERSKCLFPFKPYYFGIDHYNNFIFYPLCSEFILTMYLPFVITLASKPRGGQARVCLRLCEWFGSAGVSCIFSLLFSKLLSSVGSFPSTPLEVHTCFRLCLKQLKNSTTMYLSPFYSYWAITSQIKFPLLESRLTLYRRNKASLLANWWMLGTRTM